MINPTSKRRPRKYFAPQNEGAIHQCDHPGCDKKGEYKAPRDKSLKSYYWFCFEHVQENNSKWNYYKDGNEEKEDGNSSLLEDYEYEVIGNIHDNPEILKGREGK